MIVRGSAGMDTPTRLFCFDVFQPDPTPCTEAIARLFDPAQEPWIVLKAVVEPVLLGFETNQHSRWLAMARDDDLVRLSLARPLPEPG